MSVFVTFLFTIIKILEKKRYGRDGLFRLTVWWDMVPCSKEDE